jgi:protein-disulfide isomerase
MTRNAMPDDRQLGGNMRFAFRYFPLTSIHPHALAAAAAAEAAALQGRFWDMHELLFYRQNGVVHRGGHDPPTLLAALAP